MIIYIYGSDGFKKEIHSVLNHANIKFRLDEHGEIKDLKSINELKKAIEDNPNNIYLIDDDKIIKKNSLNQKIKFLKPKDGIEQEYLLDNGIGDISVDSVDELSKHIIKRLEAIIQDKESDDIQESIVEIVEDAYEQDSEDENSYIQLDDELSALLSHQPEEEKIEQIDEIDAILPEVEESAVEDLSFEEDLDNILNISEDIADEKIEEISQGDNMADEFSEFDTLDENDILAALNETVDAGTLTQTEIKSVSSASTAASSNENIDLSGSNVNDIAELISKLLNNKTLEITVKVKD